MSPAILLPDHRRGRPDPRRRTLTAEAARALLRPPVLVQLRLFEDPPEERPAGGAGGER